jgi:hypothetical protein
MKKPEVRPSLNLQFFKRLENLHPLLTWLEAALPC